MENNLLNHPPKYWHIRRKKQQHHIKEMYVDILIVCQENRLTHNLLGNACPWSSQIAEPL